MAKIQKSISLNSRCAAMFAAYYALLYPGAMMLPTCMIMLGYDSSLIAVMSSISGAISLLLRPLFGMLTDRGHCRKLCLLFSLSMAFGTVLFFFSPVHDLLHAVLYAVFESTSVACCIDLVDSWALKLVKQTGEVDYGKVRAFGSGSFAVTGLIYGWIVSKTGIVIVPYTILAFIILFLTFVFSVPDPEAGGENDEKTNLKDGFRLLKGKRFRSFVLFYALASVTYIFTDSYITVLILERGGTTAHTGLNDFIAAMLEFFFLHYYTRLADRIGTDRTVWIGMIGFFIKASLAAIMPKPSLIILACTTQLISYCFFLPSRMRFVEENVEQHEMGSALFVSSFVTSVISTFIANPIASRLIPVFGTGRAMLFFSLPALVSGIGFIVASRMQNKRSE